MLPSTLSDWLAYLERLHPKGIELGLDRVNRVKQRMGLAPAFPIITVGGTNGKGSTCAMLERILIEAGYKTGCYTSPHLLRYNERVRINGQEVEDEQLCHAFAKVEAARDDIPLTYFEFGTLAAVWLFAEVGIDVAVLEIGLGGRLDAVNAFEPSCALIMSVDIDHIDYLGNTRESIGYEKAGIYRADKPAICGDSNPPKSVPDGARGIGAQYLQIGVDFGYERNNGAWRFWGGSDTLEDLPLPALSGGFQLSNASCAIMALLSLRASLSVSAEQIRAGLVSTVLPGRFQIASNHPYVILDVAHNPHAARGLAENLRLSAKGGRTLAVFGMLADKDIAGVLHELASEVDEWFIAGIQHFRGASTPELEKIVRAAIPDARIESFDTIEAALSQACLSAGENDKIVAFGSFYTVADALRALPTIGISPYGC